MKTANFAIKANKQKGNFLVTATIAIGVMAIVSLGAMKGIDKYQDAKVGNVIQELTDLRNETTKYGQAIGEPFDATNASLSTLAGLNFWSRKQITGSGGSLKVTNEWGGLITVAVGSINTTGDSLEFTYTGVNTYGCKALGTKIDSIASRITVGGVDVKQPGAKTNAATLVDQCDLASDNGSMTFALAR